MIGGGIMLHLKTSTFCLKGFDNSLHSHLVGVSGGAGADAAYSTVLT